jgi:hypothetical protein
MKTEWRPSDWEDTKDNQHKQFGIMRTVFDSISYEAGASVMLTACNTEWVDKIEKSGLLHLYHSEVREQWKALKESMGIKEINK